MTTLQNKNSLCLVVDTYVHMYVYVCNCNTLVHMRYEQRGASSSEGDDKHHLLNICLHTVQNAEMSLQYKSLPKSKELRST